MRAGLLARALIAGLSWPALQGCVASPAPGKTPPTLAEERVCLEHHRNDPVERDRCRLDARLRKGSPPDVRPQDLPVRTGNPSD
jgi:hypothetical protein